MQFYYTLNGAYVQRATAANALAFGVPTFWCGQRGETRTYHTTYGRLTVWVWPFRGDVR